MLERLTAEVLPRHLDIIFDKMDEAAVRGDTVDLGSVMVKYIFAVFGDIAWDVSAGRVCCRLSADAQAKWEDIQDLSDAFDEAADGISYRFALPGFRFWERVLPYGARLRRSFNIIRSGAARVARDARDKMQAEELGEREPEPKSGLLVRSLLREDMSEEMVIDALVSFANAGGLHKSMRTIPQTMGRLTTRSEYHNPLDRMDRV